MKCKYLDRDSGKELDGVVISVANYGSSNLETAIKRSISTHNY
jgi:hypothetical protein